MGKERPSISEKLGMRTNTDENKSFVVLDPVYKKPIGLYTKVTVPFPSAFQRMVPVLRRQRAAIQKQI